MEPLNITGVCTGVDELPKISDFYAAHLEAVEFPRIPLDPESHCNIEDVLIQTIYRAESGREVPTLLNGLPAHTCDFMDTTLTEEDK